MSELHANIVRNFQSIHNRILAVGGDPDKIDIVAVTKGRSLDEIKSLLSLPIAALAGNYPEELITTAKDLEVLASELDTSMHSIDSFLRSWHFIGQIQRRNVRKLLPYVSLWQSIDRIEEMEKIARYSPKSKILLEVNGYDLARKAYKNYHDHALSVAVGTFNTAYPLPVGNVSRGGILISEISYFVETSAKLGLDLKGFMTIAPLGGSDVIRAAFDMLAELKTQFGMSICSMGMSSDFELAVRSGSNMLRIGKALFV